MTRLGISGHQQIPQEALAFIEAALLRRLNAARETGSLIGLTSLATGADQLFARLLRHVGGELHVILPSANYEETFAPNELAEFYSLLAEATEIERLKLSGPSEEAFLAAGRRIVEECDELIAVWDGLPARGLGGTADVVAYAHKVGRAVTVIWPAGVRR